MEKATNYRNCSICDKRRECWNTECYGDIIERGKSLYERGKQPFPNKVVCGSFTCKKEMK